MTKPTHDQAAQAFAIIDRAVSQLDCKGLSLMQARDLIQSMQIVGAFLQPDQPPQTVTMAQPPSSADDKVA